MPSSPLLSELRGIVTAAYTQMRGCDFRICERIVRSLPIFAPPPKQEARCRHSSKMAKDGRRGAAQASSPGTSTANLLRRHTEILDEQAIGRTPGIRGSHRRVGEFARMLLRSDRGRAHGRG